MTDPLADILRLTEPSSVVSGRFSATGRWALQFPPPEKLKFFAVTRGTCWLRVDGAVKETRLDQGDVVQLSGRQPFVLASDLTTPPRDARRVWKQPFMDEGGDSQLLAGHVSVDPTSGNLLLDALPPIVVVRADAAEMMRWILEHLAVEARSTAPGSSTVAGQLGQLLFTAVLRAYLTGSGRLPAGWLRALRDVRIAPALRAIHGDPRRAWRLADLARVARMSRSSFAERFRALVGAAPLAYVTAWRMRLAQRKLREEDWSVFEIGASLGYASESAFSNAFKRVVGLSPSHYRAGLSRKSSGISRMGVPREVPMLKA